jgi:predicted phosphodiesterase
MASFLIDHPYIMPTDLPKYDRTFLPAAQFEFVVLGDTHFILDPEPYAVEFNSVRDWPQRGAWAWRCVAALDADFVVHLGDLTEENAARPQQPESRRQACEQFEQLGIRPYHVAGNMDIGDKPDATMWTEWVTPDALNRYEAQFGRSWYSFEYLELHFIVLNAQIMNGPLPEATEQWAWLATDLSNHADQRMVIFMHMPPFFVEKEEPDTGFYNSINEPARSRLTDFIRANRVACLFTGHTHFRVFNRIDDTRFYVAPSTTTSRAGFYEAFSVAPPPEQGRNDQAKLGFYLVRVCDETIRVQIVHTRAQLKPDETEQGWSRLLCRTTQDLPTSPVGAFLRTPLAVQSAGALAWPSVLRQRVRDDHPFLAILEAGVKHVRVPMSDLDDDLQKTRLALLREEGVAITAVWLWSDRLDLPTSVSHHADAFDTLELQVPGALFPDAQILHSLLRCRKESGKPVVVTPIISREATKGTYHPRTRFGYRPEELAELDQHLGAQNVQIDRVICHIDPDVSPWDAFMEMEGYRGLSCIAEFDYVIRLPGTDESGHSRYVAEALFAAALQPGCRLFFDPLVDLDRTNDLNHGLLDRLSNPRPAYQVMQGLNTVLFSESADYTPLTVQSHGQDRILRIESSTLRHVLILPGENGFDPTGFDGFDIADEMDLVDLAHGWRQTGIRMDAVKRMLYGVDRPYLVTTKCG